MGQILHGSATTTHAVRAAIQRSKATAKELAERHGLDPKTVAKWKKRDFVEDAPMGPKAPRSTVLTPEEEAIAVAFRKHTLLRSMIAFMRCRRRSRISPDRPFIASSSATT